MPFEIEPMTSAPSSAAQTVPRPPNRLTPATTGPAIASSRKSLPPVFWPTACRREASRMPPIAANIDASDEDRDLDALGLDARAPRGLLVAADREDVAAEARAVADERHDRHQRHEDQQRERHAAVRVEDIDDRRRSPRRPPPADTNSRMSPGSSPAAERRRRLFSAEPKYVRDPITHGDHPPDHVGVERERQVGDRARQRQVDGAGVAQHLELEAQPGDQARPASRRTTGCRRT